MMTDRNGPERRRAWAKPRVLVLANQKGGVGKTTTAINLGTALAAIGEKVLIIDLDPQGNASTGLGIDRKSRQVSTYHVLAGEASLEESITETVVPGLSSRRRRSTCSASNWRSRTSATGLTGSRSAIRQLSWPPR